MINVMKNVVNIISVYLLVFRIKLTLICLCRSVGVAIDEPSLVCFLLNSLHFWNRIRFLDFQELSEMKVLFLYSAEITVLCLLSLPETKVFFLSVVLNLIPSISSASSVVP